MKPSLLPLRQRCLETASLSGIINNSATAVSRLCFSTHMYVHRTYTHIYTYIYTYMYPIQVHVYLRFSFFPPSSSSWNSHNVFRLRREHLEQGCVCGPVGLGASMCALGPLKEIALERWEKRTGETYRGSLGLVDRDCIEVDFGS